MTSPLNKATKMFPMWLNKKKLKHFLTLLNFLFICFYFLLGCGVKGDPKPPLLSPPTKEETESKKKKLKLDLEKEIEKKKKVKKKKES